MSYVAVAHPGSQFEAQVLKDLLADAGIPCIVTGSDLSLAITGSAWGLPVVSGEIVVNAEDAERAAELIAGFEGTLGELTELSEQELDALASSRPPED